MDLADVSAAAVYTVYMDKTNTADLSSGVFAILIGVIWTKNAKFIAIPRKISSKSGKH